MDVLWKSDFAPHLNSIFVVRPRGEERTVQIELVEVSERSAGQYEFLSLLFVSSGSAEFAQDTHVIEHPAFGEFQMFVGPVWHPDIAGTCYEAVFSRPSSIT